MKRAALAVAAILLVTGCSGKSDTEQRSDPTAPAASPSPTPTPTPTPAASPTPKAVHPGAFCDRANESGVTDSGTKMACRGPGKLRWRSLDS